MEILRGVWQYSSNISGESDKYSREIVSTLARPARRAPKSSHQFAGICLTPRLLLSLMLF